MDGSAILARLRGRLGARVLETHDHLGDHTAVVASEGIVDALTFCRDDALLRFDMLMDLTAVDYLKSPGREDGPRFDVVYHLYSVAHNHRVRLKVRVEQDAPLVPTATGLWPIANWLEREVWGMFGIRAGGGAAKPSPSPWPRPPPPCTASSASSPSSTARSGSRGTSRSATCTAR